MLRCVIDILATGLSAVYPLAYLVRNWVAMVELELEDPIAMIYRRAELAADHSRLVERYEEQVAQRREERKRRELDALSDAPDPPS